MNLDNLIKYMECSRGAVHLLAEAFTLLIYENSRIIQGR